MTRSLLVGIGGGTASGKTTVANRIARVLAERAVILDQDSYYKDLSDLPKKERKRVNFDHPDAFDWDLLTAHLDALVSGQGIEKPVYSFTESARQAETERVEAASLVIVEGILILENEALRDRMDVRIFVDTDDDVRLARRLARDVAARGRTMEDVLDQYFRTVRPMHLGFVLPTKRHADVIIPNESGSDVAVQMVAAGLRAHLEEGASPG
jgi:uridine kinase